MHTEQDCTDTFKVQDNEGRVYEMMEYTTFLVHLAIDTKMDKDIRTPSQIEYRIPGTDAMILMRTIDESGKEFPERHLFLADNKVWLYRI